MRVLSVDVPRYMRECVARLCGVVKRDVSLKAPAEGLDNVGMRTNPVRAAVVAVALAIVASACSSGDAAPEVVFEARWQCDVQRQTFPSLTDLDAELDSRLTDAGMTRLEYEAFKEQLGASDSLREDVNSEYEAYCLS